MLTCKQATELASQQLDDPLRLGEQLNLNLHLLICKGCRAAKRQFHFLRTGARAYQSHLDTLDTLGQKTDIGNG